MVKIDLPTEPVADWKEAMLKKMAEVLDRYRSVRLFLDLCVKCGACADKCPFFLGTGDPKNMPAARADLLRKVYKRYFTLGGRLWGRWNEAEELNETVLKEWITYFYQCSECRRCSIFCPYGIDTAELTMAAREIMAAAGVATKYVTEVVAKVYDAGNNLGIWPDAWKNNNAFLEEDLKDTEGIDIRFPVDSVGADVLLVPPSADIFVNTNTMIGYAKMFHAAGISWTTSTYCNEGGNFGMFLNYANMKKINNRILEAARALKVKKIYWGECGHAWRAGLAFTMTLSGEMDFLEIPHPAHICDLTWDLLSRGAFRIDPSANDLYRVTYHDPCNVARAAGYFEPPRNILKTVCPHFVEMHPDTIREKTFCCGGGGGLLADEIMELRVAGGKPRAEACRASGANFMATICAICKANLPEVMKHHRVDCEIGGVHDLLGRAMVF
jgi:Fe-S oxidoreductase